MKVIIIGGTSGLGRALAGVFLFNKWEVAVTGTRDESIKDFSALYPGVTVRKMDLSDPEKSRKDFLELAEQPGGTDAVIVSAGHFEWDRKTDWEIEKKAIEINALGCAGVLNAAFGYFLKKGSGRLAGVSSIGAIRGHGACPAYNASKAFISNYLEGLRQAAALSGADISVTNVIPAYIAGKEESSARDIFKAVLKKRRNVYTPSRWRFLAALYRNIPDLLHEKMAKWHDRLLKPFK
ncbi:MAG: SDR family NAD(P)-dependent oxidoreductase [Elusimicrobia bacterium]|nr:SDR family NAD(P)-dependent oxidoreductase [Elusimicrobiota bacterium]